jgi:hypothetical protein
MQFTPSQAAEHLKESIASYIESQYRISHPLVFAERSALLRERGVIAQDPFIEATPAFATARLLRDLEQEHPDNIPPGLSMLVEHGVPVDRFPCTPTRRKHFWRALGTLRTCWLLPGPAPARLRRSSSRFLPGFSRRLARGLLQRSHRMTGSSIQMTGRGTIRAVMRTGRQVCGPSSCTR